MLPVKCSCYFGFTHPACVLQHDGIERRPFPPSEAHRPLGRREATGWAPHTDIQAVDRQTLLRPQTQQVEEVQLDTPHTYLQLPITYQRDYHRTNHRPVSPSLVYRIPVAMWLFIVQANNLFTIVEGSEGKSAVLMG